MSDNEIFMAAFDRINQQNCRGALSMQGTLVYYNGQIMFNIDGYNLGYNLYRLTDLVNKQGFFR